MWGWLFCYAAWTVILNVQGAGVGAGRLVCYVENARATDSFSECTHLVYAGDVRGEKLDALLKEFRKNNSRLKIILRISEVDKEHRALLKTKHIQGLEVYEAHRSLNKTKVSEAVEQARSAIRQSGGGVLFLALPPYPELLAKYYDMRELVKIVDFMTVQTHALGTVKKMTYHPSRLSGIWDMMNTDSVVDLVVGLGVPASKLVISLPATAYRFTLLNETHSTPDSPTVDDQPQELDQKELCKLLKKGRWTLERDQDLSAPYAFKNKTWISFEDASSVDVKVKYARVRGLAGLALHRAEFDTQTTCGATLKSTLKKVLNQQSRAPRAAVLRSLEHDILSASGRVRALDALQVSPYRITQVVDADGVIHSIREDTRTEFSCSRQGYFVHPRSCGRFYRCVKFDQLSPDYTVFEFDCPAGLAFDSRYEVCVWPGSLPYTQACPGSSEIAPVPQSRFICPEREGYYVDPENCRWFFACLDHGKSPLSAYEFRCPFGLGFDPDKLKCDWPWLVPACGNIGRYEAQAHGYSAAVLTGAAGFQGQTAEDVNVAAHQSLISGAALDNLVGIQGSYISNGQTSNSGFTTSPELSNRGYGNVRGLSHVAHGESLDQSDYFDDFAYQLGEASFWDKSVVELDKRANYYRGSLVLDDSRVTTNVEYPSTVVVRPTAIVNRPSKIAETPTTIEGSSKAFVDSRASFDYRPALSSYKSNIFAPKSFVFGDTPTAIVDSRTTLVDNPTTFVDSPTTFVDHPSTFNIEHTAFVDKQTTTAGGSDTNTVRPTKFIDSSSTFAAKPTTVVDSQTTFDASPSIFNNGQTTFIDEQTASGDRSAAIIGQQTSDRSTTFVNRPTTIADSSATFFDHQSTFNNGNTANVEKQMTTAGESATITARPSTFIDSSLTFGATPTTFVDNPTTYVASPTIFNNGQTTFIDEKITSVGESATIIGQPTTFVTRPTTIVDRPTTINGKFATVLDTVTERNTDISDISEGIENISYDKSLQNQIEVTTSGYLDLDIINQNNGKYQSDYQTDISGKYIHDASGNHVVSYEHIESQTVPYVHKDPGYQQSIYYPEHLRHLGEYQTDHRGKYVPDYRGKYIHDNSGQYFEAGNNGQLTKNIASEERDSKGKYIHDARGEYVEDTSGRYVKADFTNGRYNHDNYAIYSTFNQNDNKGKYVKDERGKYIHDNLGQYIEANASNTRYNNQQTVGYVAFTPNDRKGKYTEDQRGRYIHDDSGKYFEATASSKSNNRQYAAYFSPASNEYKGNYVPDYRGQYVEDGSLNNGQYAGSISTHSDSRGKYFHDNSGQYVQTGLAYNSEVGTKSRTIQSDLVGLYVNDQSGRYTYDGSGQYQKDKYSQNQSGKYIPDNSASTAFIPNNNQGKYVPDSRGQYIHNSKLNNGQYATYSSSQNDFKGKYFKDTRGQYDYSVFSTPDKLGLYNHDFSGAYKNDNPGKYVNSGATYFQQYGTNNDYLSDSKIYSGASHILTGGSVNVDLVGKTSLVDTGYLEHTTNKNKSLLQPDRKEYVTQPAVAVSHDGSDRNNYVAFSYITTPTSSGIPTTVAPFTVTSPVPSITTYKPTFSPARSNIKQIFGIVQPEVANVQKVHSQIAGSDNFELGYEYQKPIIKYVTTPTPVVSTSKYSPHVFGFNQQALGKVETVGFNYESPSPVTEEPFKKIVSYTTGPSSTNFVSPIVSTFTTSTTSPVISTYQPHIITSGAVHQVDPNLVKVYKDELQSGYKKTTTPLILGQKSPALLFSYPTSTILPHVDLTYQQPSVSVFQNPFSKYIKNSTPDVKAKPIASVPKSTSQPLIQQQTYSHDTKQPVELSLNQGYSYNQPEIQRDSEIINARKAYSDASFLAFKDYQQTYSDNQYKSENSEVFTPATPDTVNFSPFPGTKGTTINNQIRNQSPEIQSAYETMENLPLAVSAVSSTAKSTYTPHSYTSVSSLSPVSVSASREYLPPATTAKSRIKSTTQIPSPKFIESTTPYRSREYLPPKKVTNIVTFDNFGLDDKLGTSTPKINYNPYQEAESRPSSTYRKHNIVIEKAKSNLLGFSTVGPDAGLVSPIIYTTRPPQETTKTYTSRSKSGASSYSSSGQREEQASSTTSQSAQQKVSVVTKINDYNPLLVKKLEAVCSCQSPVVVLRGKQPSSAADLNIDDLDDNDRSDTDSSRVTQTVIVNTSPALSSTINPIIVPEEPYYQDNQQSSTLKEGSVANRSKILSKSIQSDTTDILSTAPKRSRNKSSTIAPTYESVLLTTASGSKTFDRYGPGGWRSKDETLQGSVDCQRAGLFRHPKECNRFYACRWDETKQRFTLHVFNCPVQLNFDLKIGACNWPSQGPTCQGDTLLTNIL